MSERPMSEASSAKQAIEHEAGHASGRVRKFVRERPALSIGIAGVVAALFEAELIAAALIGGATMLAVTRREGSLKEKLSSAWHSVLDRVQHIEPMDQSPTHA